MKEVLDRVESGLASEIKEIAADWHRTANDPWLHPLVRNALRECATRLKATYNRWRMDEDKETKLVNLFCPWMRSEHEAGSYEYARDVVEMFAAEGLTAQVAKTESGWFYAEPSNTE